MSIFTDADIIHAHTRAQALADGALVDVTDTAREAGFSIPVALTRAAWEDLAEWTDEDDARKRGGWTGQSTEGRLWDVLFLGAWAARTAKERRSRLTFEVHRVKREGRGTAPHRTLAVLHVGPGDNAEPVATIMLPSES